MAISEYSDTVMENMNKTHNEIMFLYNMLNDKHTELTGLATDYRRLQQMSRAYRKEWQRKKQRAWYISYLLPLLRLFRPAPQKKETG